MVNVSGWDVEVRNAEPVRVSEWQNGWVHSCVVSLASDGSLLGILTTVTTRGDGGGRELARWTILAGTTERVVGGNLQDLVAGAILKRHGFNPFAGVESVDDRKAIERWVAAFQGNPLPRLGDGSVDLFQVGVDLGYVER